ncbi:hypothetical protein CHS0354_000595 [Potamilus streckersoni]|uniref:PBP domain-containing protein n=1 Tax=Potamilus streckersoni TaxID=2493646 RepID=A0AAE0T786_9BIVA|nr:hypothetical protein CHS0354_000595 [Potamilus streckersoni]
MGMFGLQGCGEVYTAKFDRMPEGLDPSQGLSKLSYNSEKKELTLNGYLNEEEWKTALSLSDDSLYRGAINHLFEWSFQDETVSRGLLTISVQKEIVPIAKLLINAYKERYAGTEFILRIKDSREGVMRDLSEKLSRAGIFFYSHQQSKQRIAKDEGINKERSNARVIFRDAACLIAFPGNKVSKITFHELRKLFEGKVKTWKELKGSNFPIKVFAVRSSFYFKSILDTLACGVDETIIQYCNDENEVVEKTKESKGALGIVGLSNVKYALAVKKENRDTTSFKVMGVASSSSHPFYKPYQVFVLRKNYPFYLDVGFLNLNNVGKLPFSFSGFVKSGNSGQSMIFLCCAQSERKEETTTSGTLKIAGDFPSKLYLELLIAEFVRIWPLAEFQTQYVSTSQAIKAFLNREVDMIIISRGLNGDEKIMLIELGSTTVQKVATDAVSIAVNPKNPVKKLTLEEVKNIFSGSIKNWSEVGGKNAEIKLFVTDKNDAQRQILEDSLNLSFSKAALSYPSFTEVKKEIEIEEHAIGYVSMAAFRKEGTPSELDTSLIKMLSIAKKKDGYYVPPRQAYVYNGDYPLSHAVNCVTFKHGRLSKGFTSFIQREGQKVYSRNGLAPIKIPSVVINFKEY